MIPIVISTDVSFLNVQVVADVPPTVALQLAAASCATVTKLAPVNVIVLLTYPTAGFALNIGKLIIPDDAPLEGAVSELVEMTIPFS